MLSLASASAYHAMNLQTVRECKEAPGAFAAPLGFEPTVQKVEETTLGSEWKHPDFPRPSED